MGYYVHIHIAFACTNNEPVAKVAKKYLDRINTDSDGGRAAKWFLEDLSQRTGTNIGPKGGLSLWGMVGNYTKAEDFVEELQPFFKELFERRDVDLLKHERIIVFEEREQTEAASVWKIGYDEATSELVVKETGPLPFSWGQY